jgi:FdhD protein
VHEHVSAVSRVAVNDGTGISREHEWQLAVEVPVQIRVNDAPFTVMLATPADLDDLARGLLLTEQVVATADDIDAVHTSSYLGDVQVNVTVRDGALRGERIGARSLLGNSGCGLCGIESLAQLHAREARRGAVRVPIADTAICRAFAQLPAHQPLNAATRSVHGAAWCTPEGSIVLVREDVGRHNALDKLIGALATRGLLQEAGFVVMTSRCSYELVYKATAANTQLLATISSPTTMALQWARSVALPVVSTMHRDGHLSIVRFPETTPSEPVPHAG